MQSSEDNSSLKQQSTRSESLRDADITNGERPLPSDQLVGTIFAEKYKILAVLGEGGMSMVYQAQHLLLKKTLAVKVLHTHLSGRSNAQVRFRQEAQSASSLSHPGIIGIHDYGVTEDGTPYLVMDYVEGESLGELLDREVYVKPERALQIFGETCAAIAHAHDHDVVHRDLKPSNIMLARDANGETHAKVVDFGVAKVLGEPSQSNPGKLTQTGDFVGSPFYMSPEQCSGKQLDARSDVYSMGCVMYETLTGQVAFASDSIYGTMFKHLNEMPESIASVRPELAKYTSLEKVILKALAKDPGKRYQSMRELLVDISALRLGQKAGLMKRLSESLEVLALKGKAVKYGIICGAVVIVCLVIIALLIAPRGVLALNHACPPESVDVPAIAWKKYPPPVAIDSSDAAKDLTTDQQQKLGRDMSSNYASDPSEFAKRCQVQGKFLLLHGRYEQAISWWVKSIKGFEAAAQQKVCIEESERETRLRASYSSLAECYYRLNYYKEAAQSYEQRRAIDTKLSAEREWLYDRDIYVRATLSEADCLFRLKEYDKAQALLNIPQVRLELANFADAFTKHPMTDEQKQITLAVYCSELGDLARRAKQYRAAERQYETALRIWSPGSDDSLLAQIGLASSLERDGQQGQALAAYEAVWNAVQQKKVEQIAQNEAIVAGLEQYSDMLLKQSNMLHNQSDFWKGIEVYQKAKAVRTAQPA